MPYPKVMNDLGRYRIDPCQVYLIYPKGLRNLYFIVYNLMLLFIFILATSQNPLHILVSNFRVDVQWRVLNTSFKSGSSSYLSVICICENLIWSYFHMYKVAAETNVSLIFFNLHYITSIIG